MCFVKEILGHATLVQPLHLVYGLRILLEIVGHVMVMMFVHQLPTSVVLTNNFQLTGLKSAKSFFFQ